MDQILKNLDLQHPVGVLLQQVCHAHHDTYRSCNKTLLTMICYWNRAAQALLNEGVPVEKITEHFREGVELCITELDTVAIPIRELPSYYIQKRPIDAGKCNRRTPSSNHLLGNLAYSGIKESSLTNDTKESPEKTPKNNLQRIKHSDLSVKQAADVYNLFPSHNKKDNSSDNGELCRTTDSGDEQFVRNSNGLMSSVSLDSSKGHDMTIQFQNAPELNSVDSQELRNQYPQESSDADDVSWYFDSAAEADGSVIDRDFYSAMAGIARVFNTIGGGLNGSLATMDAMFPLARLSMAGQGQGQIGLELGQGHRGVQSQGHRDVRSQGHHGVQSQGCHSVQIQDRHGVQSQGHHVQTEGQGQIGLELGQGHHDTQSQGHHSVQSQGLHGVQSQGRHGVQIQNRHGVQSQGLHVQTEGQGQSHVQGQSDAIRSNKPSRKEGTTYSSLLGNSDNDDDFDDCFRPAEKSSASQFKLKTDRSEDENLLCGVSVIPKNPRSEYSKSLHGDHHSIVSSSADSKRVVTVPNSNVSSDDEFDACFEGVKYVETATDIDSSRRCNDLSSVCYGVKPDFEGKVQSEKNLGVHGHLDGFSCVGPQFHSGQTPNLQMLSNNMKFYEGLHFDEVVRDSISEDTNPAENNFKDLLAAKMREKNLAFKERIQNSCRYFKTFESSIREMEKSCASASDSPDWSTGNEGRKSQVNNELADRELKKNDFETILAAKLAEKKDKLKDRVHNSCRHFKTIASSVNEMNSCYTPSAENGLQIENPVIPHKPSSDIEDNAQNLDELDISWYFDSTKDSCKENENYDTGDAKGASKDQIDMNSHHLQDVEVILDALREGLHHGRPDEMALAVDIYKMQVGHGIHESDGLPRFDINKVHTCHMQSVGLRDPNIVSGFVIDVDNMQLSSLEKHTQHHILMVNGDVTPSFTHKGYNEKHTSKQVGRDLGDVSGDSWLAKMVKIIQKLTVNTILVKGHVHPDLPYICVSRDVAILENVPYKVLHAVSMATGVEPLSYITDATKLSVTSEVVIRPYRDDWMCWPSDRSYICLELSLPIQTVIFSHPCQPVGRLLEEHFWHCVHRLANSLTSNRLLPGAGQTENLVQKSLQHIEKASYQSSVYDAIAKGFWDYSKTVGSRLENVSTMEATWPRYVPSKKYRTRQDTKTSQQNDSSQGCEHLFSSSMFASNDRYSTTSGDFDSNIDANAPSNSTHHVNAPSNSTHHVNAPSNSAHHVNAPSNSAHHVNASSNSVHNGSDFVQKTSLPVFPARPVFDDYLAKKEAWRKAADFVCSLLQTDMYIVTGVGETTFSEVNSYLGKL